MCTGPWHGLGAITIAGDGKARLASFATLPTALCPSFLSQIGAGRAGTGASPTGPSQAFFCRLCLFLALSLSLSMIYHALPYHLAGDKVIEIDSSESPEREPLRGQFEKCCFSRVNHFCAIAGTDARKGSRNFLSPTPKWSPGGWDSFSVLLFVLLLISPLAGKDGSDPKGEKGGWDSFSVLLCVLLLNHLLQEPKDPTRRGNREAGVLIVLCCGRYQNACRKRFQRIRAEGGKGRLGFCLCCAVVDIKMHAGKDSKGSAPKGEKGGWGSVCVVLLLVSITRCRRT